MNSTKESGGIRKFKRYKSQTHFQLTFDAHTFNCKLLDYSDGLKAVIFDCPLVRPGTYLDIKIPQPSIDISGEVVWSRKFHSETLVGVKRKDTIKGTFKDFKLSDILIGLNNSAGTGVLEVKVNSAIKKVYLKNGEMVFATSNEEEDRIAEFLLKVGRISYAQYCHTLKVYNKGRKKQGTILVESGYLTPRELIKILKRQVEEIIISLFTIENGEFEFTEGLSPEYEPFILDIDSAQLIYQGIKRINRFVTIKRFSPDIDTHLYLVENKPRIFQSVSLDDIDKRVFSFVSDKISMKNILSLSPFNDFETLKSLYALSGIGLISVHEEDSELSSEDLMAEFKTEEKDEFLSQIQEQYQKCNFHEYYQILNISPSSSTLDIKRAYYQMATKFHPDKHAAYASQEVKTKLTKIFTHLTEAYTILSDSDRRKEYDKSLSGQVLDRERAEENTDSSESSYSSQARTIFNDGLLEMWNHNLTKAAQLFCKALQLDGSQSKYFYYHGYVLRQKKNFKEALESLNNALRLDPDNPDYIAELGYISLGLGLSKKAQINFEKALKISPSNKKARAGLNEMEEQNKGKYKTGKLLSLFTSK
jgi:curved DNA-binding protein CbpA